MSPTSAPNLQRPIVIATRESRLAMWQAEHVQAILQARGFVVDLLGMTTQGDQILDRSLSKVGGKGLFVKELEVALAEGRADIAVHSLKDVPMDMPEGFELACVMEREDPRDAWVSAQYPSLFDLPQGAVVGTSSLRRTVLLRALRPDLKIEPLRGNLDTRLRKLDEGQYAGIILAAAGLKRLKMADRIRHIFETDQMARVHWASKFARADKTWLMRSARWCIQHLGWQSPPSVLSAVPWGAVARCPWQRMPHWRVKYSLCVPLGVTPKALPPWSQPKQRVKSTTWNKQKHSA